MTEADLIMIGIAIMGYSVWRLLKAMSKAGEDEEGEQRVTESKHEKQ